MQESAQGGIGVTELFSEVRYLLDTEAFGEITAS